MLGLHNLSHSISFKNIVVNKQRFIASLIGKEIFQCSFKTVVTTITFIKIIKEVSREKLIIDNKSFLIAWHTSRSYPSYYDNVLN